MPSKLRTRRKAKQSSLQIQDMSADMPESRKDTTR